MHGQLAVDALDVRDDGVGRDGQHLADVAETQLPAPGWFGVGFTGWEANVEARFDNFRAYDVATSQAGQ